MEQMEKGQITVSTENIFPIIKQFLYSEQEIFLRELISNAVDATSKLKTLSSRGTAKGELGNLTIEIIADKDAKTLTIRDKGIGLTAEETKKYLNQVAFSSYYRPFWAWILFCFHGCRQSRSRYAVIPRGRTTRNLDL